MTSTAILLVDFTSYNHIILSELKASELKLHNYPKHAHSQQ